MKVIIWQEDARENVPGKHIDSIKLSTLKILKPPQRVFERVAVNLCLRSCTLSVARFIGNLSPVTITTVDGKQQITFVPGQPRLLDPMTYYELPKHAIAVIGDESYVYRMKREDAIPLLDKEYKDYAFRPYDINGTWLFIRHHGTGNGLIPLMWTPDEWTMGGVIYATRNGKVISAMSHSFSINAAVYIKVGNTYKFDSDEPTWSIEFIRNCGTFDMKLYDMSSLPVHDPFIVKYDIDTGYLEWWRPSEFSWFRLGLSKKRTNVKVPYLPSLCALSSHFSKNVLSSIFSLL